MGAEISMVALEFSRKTFNSKGESPSMMLIGVCCHLREVGGNNLRTTLESEDGAGFIIGGELGISEDSGFRRFLVCDARSLATAIEKRRDFEWEGFYCPEEVIEYLRKFPNAVWWFHIHE